MLQFSSITPNAQSIIEKFIKSCSDKKSSTRFKKLIVSLYAMMPNSDFSIVQILEEYNVLLDDYLYPSEIEQLKKEYSSIIKYCFDQKRKTYLGGIYRGEWTIPQSIVDLCMRLANPKEGSKVFLPYAGEADFIYPLMNCNIQGFELTKTKWAFIQILINAIGDTNIHHIDDIQNDINGEYDYVFSFIPSLQSIERNVEMKRSKYDTINRLITEKLSYKGEFYGIFPKSFCTTEHCWWQIRKVLKESNCYYKNFDTKFDTLVINLPRKNFAEIELCLVRFRRSDKDLVTLVDASSENFLLQNVNLGKRNVEIDIEAILDVIGKKDEKYVWINSPSELSLDISLLPARYLISQFLPNPQENETVFELRNLLSIVEYERSISRIDMLIPTITTRNLSTNYLNCDINVSELDTLKNCQGNIITEDCILLSFQEGQFKVGKLKGVSPQTPVRINYNVEAIRLTSNVITPDFFLRSIMSPLAKQQANVLVSGDRILYLRSRELLTIKLFVPPIEEQKRICTQDIRKNLTEAERKILDSYDDFRKDLRMKMHAIGQTLYVFNNWFDILQKVRKEGNGVVSDHDVVGKNCKIAVSSIYNNLQNALNQLNMQIAKFDRGSNLEKENVDLLEFIKDYISRKESPIFTFDFLSKQEDSEDNNGNMPYAIFSRKALEIIFDNIVSNACCHGFVNRDDTDNIILIELLQEGDNWVIKISNNGEALNSQFDSKDVFIYGKTSIMGEKVSDSKSERNWEIHSGIGGYEVNHLMNEFNGEAEFISDPNSDFPITYKLTFFKSNGGEI